MKKFLLSLAAVAATLPLYAETVTITTAETSAANTSGTYVTTEFEVPVGNQKFMFQQVNPKTGQIRVNNTGTSAFNFYNTTPIEGIQSVVITASASTLGTWYMATSATEPVTGLATTSDIAGVLDADAKTMTFTVPADKEASYFHINLTTKGSGTVNFTSIEITYGSGTVVLLPAGLSFPEESYTATLGQTFAAPLLSKTTDATPVYSSSNESVATVDADGNVNILAEGTTVITAETEATETYAAGKASYTLEVVDPNSTSVSIVWGDQNYDNAQDVTSFTKAPVSIELSQGANTTNGPKYYSGDKTLRVYGNNTITVKADAGYKIARIEFTVASGYEFKTGTTANTGTFDIDKALWTSENGASSVTITSGGTTRIVSTKVVCVATSLETPTFKFPEESYSVNFGDSFSSPNLISSTDAEITYTSSDNEIATVDEYGEVTILAPGTVTISAEAPETDQYLAAKASYTLIIKAAASSIAELYKLAEGNSTMEVIVNFPVTVTYQNDAYTFITDGTDASLIYVRNNTAYNTGDVIPAGWTTTYTVYNDLDELLPVGTLPEATQNVGFSAPVVNELTNDMVNEVVIIKNVEVTNDVAEDTTSYKALYNGGELTIYNRFSKEAVAAGSYWIKGAVSIYKGQLQFYPIEFGNEQSLGVDDLAADTDAPLYFNLSGAPVANPSAGLYIRLQNGKATKVIIR